MLGPSPRSITAAPPLRSNSIMRRTYARRRCRHDPARQSAIGVRRARRRGLLQHREPVADVAQGTRRRARGAAPPGCPVDDRHARLVRRRRRGRRACPGQQLRAGDRRPQPADPAGRDDRGAARGVPLGRLHLADVRPGHRCPHRHGPSRRRAGLGRRRRRRRRPWHRRRERPPGPLDRRRARRPRPRCRPVPPRGRPPGDRRQPVARRHAPGRDDAAARRRGVGRLQVAARPGRPRLPVAGRAASRWAAAGGELDRAGGRRRLRRPGRLPRRLPARRPPVRSGGPYAARADAGGDRRAGTDPRVGRRAHRRRAPAGDCGHHRPARGPGTRPLGAGQRAGPAPARGARAARGTRRPAARARARGLPRRAAGHEPSHRPAPARHARRRGQAGRCRRRGAARRVVGASTDIPILRQSVAVTYVSFGRRLTDLAAAAPDRPAVSCGEQRLTRRQLDELAAALAHDLAGLGVTLGDMVTIALPNSVDWFVAAAAAWKVGATPQPVAAHLPAPELRAIVELADPAVVLGATAEDAGGRPWLADARPSAEGSGALAELPDVVAPAWKAPTSGGSTGRPKLIVSGDPGLVDLDGTPPLLFQRDGCLVMPGPLYHNGPIVWSCQALMWGGHVVVLPRFDAEATLAAIEAHRADVVYLVPTMMKRIWRLPEEVRTRYDLSSLRVVWHLAEPCPPWLKEAWITWLGAERVVELYGGTEGQMATVITG